MKVYRQSIGLIADSQSSVILTMPLKRISVLKGAAGPSILYPLQRWIYCISSLQIVITIGIQTSLQT